MKENETLVICPAWESNTCWNPDVSCQHRKPHKWYLHSCTATDAEEEQCHTCVEYKSKVKAESFAKLCKESCVGVDKEC